MVPIKNIFKPHLILSDHADECIDQYALSEWRISSCFGGLTRARGWIE